jgi:putative addiction module killer protein
MDAYEVWADSLAEARTRARIDRDVGKMRRGLFGDWKETDGIFEMRLDYGPGYRVYYGKHGSVVVVLLGGGDKKSQSKDLARARTLWEKIRDEIKTL